MACVMPPSYPAPTYRMRVFHLPTAQRPGTLGISIRAVVHADGRYMHDTGRDTGDTPHRMRGVQHAVLAHGRRKHRHRTMPMPWDPASERTKEGMLRITDPTEASLEVQAAGTSDLRPASIPRSSQGKPSPPCTSGCRSTIESLSATSFSPQSHVPATSMRRDREPCA